MKLKLYSITSEGCTKLGEVFDVPHIQADNEGTVFRMYPRQDAYKWECIGIYRVPEGVYVEVCDGDN